MSDLIRWEPMGSTRQFRNLVDRFFDDYFSWPSNMPARWSQFGAHVPVDVIESEKEFTIKANVPGMSKEDLEVEIGEDAVVLKGKYDSETEKDERGYKIKERHAGSFTRVVPVSSAVNTEKATARYKDGVLELVLPKLVPETPKRRKLDVQ